MYDVFIGIICVFLDRKSWTIEICLSLSLPPLVFLPKGRAFGDTMVVLYDTGG